MSRAIAIVAALPGELAPLVRRWPRLTTSGTVRAWKTTWGEDTCVAVCAGMGSATVTQAFAALQQWVAPTLLVSVGWAGALTPELPPGDICRPACIVDARTGERFGSSHAGSTLVTLDHVAGPDEKRRVRDAYRADAVDMEAATLARLSTAAGVEFRCIKAISDASDAMLPDLNPFITETGQFAMARFVAHVVPRPRHWATLVRFGRHASLAAHNLTRAIQDDLGVPSL